MPNMRVTEAEKALVLQERYRLLLDHTDWGKAPCVTHAQLMIMSSWRAAALLADGRFVDDYLRCALINITHPDNKLWAKRHAAGTEWLRYDQAINAQAGVDACSTPKSTDVA